MSRQIGVLRGSLRPREVLRGSLAKPEAIRPAEYEGAYAVTPKIAESVVLPTKERFMRQDVTVEKIPQFEVTNEAGGKTLIMGDEYYA